MSLAKAWMVEVNISPASRSCTKSVRPPRKARAGSPLIIPRYTRPEMAQIWEPQTRFRIWFEIEAHAADALAELGVIPKEAAKTIWAKGKDARLRRRPHR